MGHMRMMEILDGQGKTHFVELVDGGGYWADLVWGNTAYFEDAVQDSSVVDLRAFFVSPGVLNQNTVHVP